MKLRRISEKDVDLIKQVKDLAPSYTEKAGDSIMDFLADIDLALHNPYEWVVVLLDEATVAGFCVASVNWISRRQAIVIEHTYCRVPKLNAFFFKQIKAKLCAHYKIPATSVFMSTKRNPDAWVRFFRTNGIQAKLDSYILQFTE